MTLGHFYKIPEGVISLPLMKGNPKFNTLSNLCDLLSCPAMMALLYGNIMQDKSLFFVKIYSW